MWCNSQWLDAFQIKMQIIGTRVFLFISVFFLSNQKKKKKKKMQNNQFQYPPQLAQQPPQQPQRLFHPQVAYPTMANLPPSPHTQGVFSTYSARLKHSDDNALLLPESYVTKKTRFRGDESEDEFDEYMEESEEEDEGQKQEKKQKDLTDVDQQKDKANKPKENAATLAAAAVAPPPIVSWPKTVRKKGDMIYTWFELNNISNIDEVLVPVRLDLDIDSVKLRDRFLWNMNGMLQAVSLM
jgi:hypothetical protein